MRHGRERTTPQALPTPPILTSFYACLIRPGPILASRGGSFLASAEDAARERCVAIQATLLDPNSATAKGALSGAADAIGALERQLKLAGYESNRQHEVAQRREAKAAVDKALAEQQAAERADRKHAAVLVQAGEKLAAEQTAREHFAAKPKGK